MPATTTSLDLVAGAWTLVGNPGTGRFTIQNRSRHNRAIIQIKSANGAVAPVNLDGSYELSYPEAMENKLISELWQGSATNTHLYVWTDVPGRVSISYA